jgi:FOG: WD40 repeat
MTWITSIVFLKDRPEMISCSGDGMVCVWDTDTWQFIFQPLGQHLYGVNSITISPCGSCIGISFADHSFKSETFSNSATNQTLDSKSMTVIWSPNAQVFLCYSTKGSPCIYNSKTNTLMSVIGGDISTVFTTAVFSPDSTKIAARCHNGTICLHETSTEDVSLCVIAMNMGNSGPVVFSEDGSQVAFCSDNGQLHIWNIEKEELHFPSWAVVTFEPLILTFSSDMFHIAAFSADGCLQVWNLDSGLAISLPFQGSGQWINCIKFSPDSTMIAVGFANGNHRVVYCTNGKFVSHNQLETPVSREVAVVNMYFMMQHPIPTLETFYINGIAKGWSIESGAKKYSYANKHSWHNFSIFFI